MNKTIDVPTQNIYFARLAQISRYILVSPIVGSRGVIEDELAEVENLIAR